MESSFLEKYEIEPTFLLINTSMFINYFDLVNIINLYDNFNKNKFLYDYITKANIIKKFFKNTINIFKNINENRLHNPKLCALYYFKYYPSEFTEKWIFFEGCEYKSNIIKNSKSFNDIIKQPISTKYKLFKIQLTLNIEDIKYIGW